MLSNIQLNNWFDGEIVTVTDMKIVTQAMVQMALSTSGGNPMAMGIVPSFNGTTLSTTSGFVNFGETSDTAYINNTGTNLLVCYVPPKINIIPIATDCYIYVKPLISYAGDNRTTTVSAIVYTSTSAVDTGIKLCRLKNGYLINFVTSNLGSLTAINDIYQVGDFKYSMQTNDHACGFGMWLACTPGRPFDPNQYPELYAQIGTMWGTTAGTGGGQDIFPLTTANATAVNGGITSYLFTATANNAQLTTATYQANFSVNKITPQIKFNPYLFSIDSGSTTSTLLLTGASGQLANGGKLLLDIASTTSEYTIMSLTETPLAGSIAYKITGGADTGYTYALNGVHLPTLASMTISSNVATANANNASAQSWDYVANSNVSALTPVMSMALAPLTVSSSSTIGNLIINSNVSGLLTNGDKLIYDTGSTVAETSGIAVNTSGGGFITVVGNIYPHIFNDGSIVIHDGGDGRVITTTTSFLSWNKSSTNCPAVIQAPHALAKLNDWYYLAGFGGTSNMGIYRTKDFETYTIVKPPSVTNPVYGIIESNGTLYVIEYQNQAGGNTAKTYTSTDGITWATLTTFTLGSTTGSTTIYQFVKASNGEFLVCTETGIAKSSDFISWTSIVTTINGNITSSASQGNIGLNFFNGKYVLACYNVNNTTTSGILTATTFTPGVANWALVNSGISFNTLGSIIVTPDNLKLLICRKGQNTLYTSTNATSFTLTSSTGYIQPDYFISATNGVIVKNSINPNLVYSADNGNSWNIQNISTKLTDTVYSITSPSLPVAIPTKVYKGGQGLQYSVQASSIPAFSTPTSPTFTRAADSLTKTYATVTGLSGTHVQLKAINYNTGDILTSLEGALITGGGSGSLYTITTLPAMTNVPIWAAKGGQQLQYSVSSNTTPNYNVATIGGYIRAVDNITATATQISGTSGQYVNIRAANINNTETINYIGAEVQDSANVHYAYEVTGNTRSNTTIGILPLLPNASGKGLSVYNANHPVGSSYGADSYSVPLVGHTHTAGFIGVAHTHTGSIALDPHTHGIQDPGHTHLIPNHASNTGGGAGLAMGPVNQNTNGTSRNTTGISIQSTTINGTATIQSATAGGSVTVNPVGTAGATMSVIQPTLYVKNLFIFAK